jgi:hypothetical protein
MFGLFPHLLHLYPLSMNLALAGLSYGITVVALLLLAIRTKKLIGIYKKGQADPNPWQRQKAAIEDGLR